MSSSSNSGNARRSSALSGYIATNWTTRRTVSRRSRTHGCPFILPGSELTRSNTLVIYFLGRIVSGIPGRSTPIRLGLPSTPPWLDRIPSAPARIRRTSSQPCISYAPSPVHLRRLLLHDPRKKQPQNWVSILPSTHDCRLPLPRCTYTSRGSDPSFAEIQLVS